MTNKLKYTCLIGSFMLAASIIVGYKVFTNRRNNFKKVSLLCYEDKNNLYSSIKHLFEGESKKNRLQYYWW